ncbi:MAG: hypothetical protein KC438_01210 [Thermomicrobiales bacterium]|nr:hypothetical protein [Thermomicrobiales bacterium]
MKRFLSLLGVLLLGILVVRPGLPSVSAQNEAASPAFTNTRIGTYGLPTLVADGSESGFTFSATEAAEGKLHVVLTSVPGVASYVSFMQMPEGLDPETATEQALLMARDDVPSAGWTYAGGSYAISGEAVEFIVDLTPGVWQVAASYQPEGGEEMMTLTPFTVHAGTPVAADELQADVVLELQDVAFGLSSAVIPTGPQIWHVTNTGEQPRQMVLFKTSRLMNADDFAAMFASMSAGTPTPEFTSMIWVGYTAVASSGYGTWLELDLEPGTYAATSWVIDAETQMPALLLGMVEGFTVE